jgi:hypothetical protein
MTEALIHESLDRAEAEARAVLAACAEGDTLRTQIAVNHAIRSSAGRTTSACRCWWRSSTSRTD